MGKIERELWLQEQRMEAEALQEYLDNKTDGQKVEFLVDDENIEPDSLLYVEYGVKGNDIQEQSDTTIPSWVYVRYRMHIELTDRPESTVFIVESGNWYIQRSNSIIDRQLAIEVLKDSLVKWGSYYSNIVTIRFYGGL